jgi:hemolysin-activating ACP:hemolysin acyltransferase
MYCCNRQEVREHAQKIGYAVMLMLLSPKYSSFHVLTLRLWTEQAILHNQIQFFFDPMGEPLAYVTWALLSEETEDRWVSDPNILFHPSEWNEGDRLWIIDFCAPKGKAREIIRHLKEKCWQDHNTVFWLKRRKDGTVYKTYSFTR